MDKSIYFTFDMDWAADFVLTDFLELVQSLKICATVFVTHYTPVLEEMKNDKIELGIHPNYNPLLQGESGNRTCGDVLREIKNIVPEAVSCRSHALTQSSIISREYEKIGILYDLNTYIPIEGGNFIYPWDAPLGNHKVLPFIFEDDIALAGCNESLRDYRGGVTFY